MKVDSAPDSECSCSHGPSRLPKPDGWKTLPHGQLISAGGVSMLMCDWRWSTLPTDLLQVGQICQSSCLWGRRGFTRQPENSKRAHLRVPAFQNTTKIPREDPQRESVIGGGKGKKKERNFGWSVGGRSGGGRVQKNIDHAQKNVEHAQKMLNTHKKKLNTPKKMLNTHTHV